ncbi:MAG: hypothetical protein HKN06_11480 [Gammaproteobacteria bacterium]|nr:hypothetical protein [Gammaproteobacteria bacterium]
MKPAQAQDPGTDRGLKQGLLAAFRRLLRPLVRILIRHGIAYGEFAEVAKTVFVETAAEDFALPGRKSSGSRIAILTGLTRKEVKRLIDQATKGQPSTRSNLSRAGRVLAGWYSDPRFTSQEGAPLQLPFESKTSPSFTELVRRYSGDMPARAMLEELLRVAAVREDEDGAFTVLSRVYIPFELDRESVERLGMTLHDLGATIAFNLDPKRDKSAKFERRVYTTQGIEKHDAEEFQLFVASEGQKFLEKLDDWLTGRESTEQGRNTLTKTGVGLYFFDEPMEPDE